MEEVDLYLPTSNCSSLGGRPTSDMSGRLWLRVFTSIWSASCSQSTSIWLVRPMVTVTGEEAGEGGGLLRYLLLTAGRFLWRGRVRARVEERPACCRQESRRAGSGGRAGGGAPCIIESTRGGESRAEGRLEGVRGGGGGEEVGVEAREKAPLSYSESEGTEEAGERSRWGGGGGGEEWRTGREGPGMEESMEEEDRGETERWGRRVRSIEEVSPPSTLLSGP